jgi:hypothetical protein
VYADGVRGPVREVASGSGYWSANEAAQTLGLGGVAVRVWVRWPGGREGEHAVAPGASAIEIRTP